MRSNFIIEVSLLPVIMITMMTITAVYAQEPSAVHKTKDSVRSKLVERVRQKAVQAWIEKNGKPADETQRQYEAAQNKAQEDVLRRFDSDITSKLSAVRLVAGEYKAHRDALLIKLGDHISAVGRKKFMPVFEQWIDGRDLADSNIKMIRLGVPSEKLKNISVERLKCEVQKRAFKHTLWDATIVLISFAKWNDIPFSKEDFASVKAGAPPACTASNAEIKTYILAASAQNLHEEILRVEKAQAGKVNIEKKSD